MITNGQHDHYDYARGQSSSMAWVMNGATLDQTVCEVCLGFELGKNEFMVRGEREGCRLR